MIWQPIETAPKDGSDVLLFAHIPPTEFLGFNEPQIVTGYFDKMDDGWCTTVPTVFGIFVTPTHWMPLPPAPKGDTYEDELIIAIRMAIRKIDNIIPPGMSVYPVPESWIALDDIRDILLGAIEKQAPEGITEKDKEAVDQITDTECLAAIRKELGHE